MPTPPRPGGVAWATIVSLSLMMFLLLCVADARCLSALRKKKGGQLTALILAKTHRIRIFSSRGYAGHVFQTTVNQLLLNNGYQVADDIVQHQT